MLDTNKLPIEQNKFSQKDQVFIITGADWTDYQKLDYQEYPGYKAFYFHGEITIVSPGKNHERIAGIINFLIISYCEKFEIPCFLFGQTRLDVPERSGREPDHAYAFGKDKDLPDLVVEVIFTSGDINTLLESYAKLKIPEVWIWKNNQLIFYCLDVSEYKRVTKSQLLNKIESEFFVKFINRGLTEDTIKIKKDFLVDLEYY